MRTPPWLRFLDETSKNVTAVTFMACVYTRSAAVSYFAVGALACTLSTKLVKNAIRQPRPWHGEKASYGMPSTHASACTFLAVSVLLGSLYLPLHSSLHSLVVFAPWVVVPWAALINLSRVWLGYHTWRQVMGGVFFGSCFAALWFNIWMTDMGGMATLAKEMEECIHMA